MKRKTFILSTVAATAIIAVPLVSGRFRHWLSRDPLSTPDVLAHLCDENKIREMGTDYRGRVPSERTKNELAKLLLTDITSIQLESPDDAAITGLMEKKIQEDFSANRIVVLQGWVISVTEARQCALFSLT
jgi:isopentenyl phosphate kinase